MPEEELKKLKEEIKQEENETLVLNEVTDYDIAREILTLLINKRLPISAKRGQKILDMAKSMLPDIAHIYYK